jgi:hypothetical protein
VSGELEQRFVRGLGGTCDKWRHYFEIYERHMGRFRNTTCTYLEIGVQRGGSLTLMQEYLGPQAKVVGIDIDPVCANTPGHKVYIGDQADAGFLGTVAEDVGPLDIVVDDGGHKPDQQLVSFLTLFPRLRFGGVYIVEDLHCSYWAGFGESRFGINFYDFAKGLTDKMAMWYLDRSFANNRAMKPREERQGSRQMGNFAAEQIFNISFYDSLVAFEKRSIREPLREVR